MQFLATLEETQRPTHVIINFQPYSDNPTINRMISYETKQFHPGVSGDSYFWQRVANTISPNDYYRFIISLDLKKIELHFMVNQKHSNYINNEKIKTFLLARDSIEKDKRAMNAMPFKTQPTPITKQYAIITFLKNKAQNLGSWLSGFWNSLRDTVENWRLYLGPSSAAY